MGLPKLEAALAAGKSINEAGCAALLAMLALTYLLHFLKEEPNE